MNGIQRTNHDLAKRLGVKLPNDMGTVLRPKKRLRRKLRPGRRWKGSLDAYYASDLWQRRRARHLAKYPRCYFCEADQGLQVHHTTYRRLGREKHRDLYTLCAACHLNEHGGWAWRKRRR